MLEAPLPIHVRSGKTSVVIALPTRTARFVNIAPAAIVTEEPKPAVWVEILDSRDADSDACSADLEASREENDADIADSRADWEDWAKLVH